MSPTFDSSLKIERLDGSNYVLWNFKIKMYQMSKGLWGTVSYEERVTEAKEQQAHAAIVLN